MWLFRGAQSAVFYYATCTPCANSIDRRKRKKEAARSRSEREKQQSDAIITDQPQLFSQPTPFSTNPGWMEELALGPGPPKRRGGHRSTAHYRMDSWDTGALSIASCEGPGLSLTTSQKLSNIGSRHLGDRWNRMLRYQREDEPLWGEEMEVKGSSVGLSGRGKVNARTPSRYYIPRVPPVNDLHPPIVSGPKSRAETRWMLQPPPSAKVMAGKEQSPTLARPVNYGSLRLGSARRGHTLPPLAINITEKSPDPSTSSRFCSPETPASLPQDLPRAPSPSFFAYGKDESHFVISSSFYSASEFCSTLSSLADSDLDPPDTPVSRPVSKGPGSHNEAPPPLISRSLITTHRDNKEVHLLRLQLEELHDLEIGQVERVRPWRWSMDI
ncbi:uncharacterized protein BJX67DRAFT_185291 [Aspergillus lucknowensis]|uniref:Uncharacterized protein n=1 Tax=Aspergillus lucknowensis TaxID=176173 RepID=A0ABR4LLP0_9EURO